MKFSSWLRKSIHHPPQIHAQVFDLRMLRQTLPLSFAPAMIAPNLLGKYALADT